MIPVKYRYELVKEWCKENNCNIKKLSETIFGSSTKIVNLSKYSDGKERRLKERLECWKRIEEYTKLDFSYKTPIKEMEDILVNLKLHLSRHGNTILTHQSFKDLGSEFLLEALASDGFDVSTEIVKYDDVESIIFRLK